MNENNVCDCGHPESPHSEITRGYGKDSEGKTHCYTCCAEEDKRIMRDDGKILLYFTVVNNGTSNYGKVTNWPGSLVFDYLEYRKSWHNIGRVRYDFWFFFEGYIWHGYQIGDYNQIAYCKRTKQKA